jgi:hypothetical protein
MAGTTTKGFRYPQNADQPNVAVDIQNLATDIDTYLTGGATLVTLTGTQTLTNKTLTSPSISNPTFTGQATGLEIAFSQNIVFEGTTADAYELTLSAGDPTADRTVTLPNATTTLVGRDTTDTLTNKTLTNAQVSGLQVTDASIIFEGTTADAYETVLTVGDPTADNTITLPDESGTLTTQARLNNVIDEMRMNALMLGGM